MAANQVPQPLSLASIQLRATRAERDEGLTALLAGTPVGLAAPDGLAAIISKGSRTPSGLTLLKNAAAFVPPSFQTVTSHQRAGYKVEHYAVIQRASSRDAVHESFYPLPGEHRKPGQTRQVKGKTYRLYWSVSEETSKLIRRGEQEHLDDARRAYELTYKCIENHINALAGKKFGPATSPAGADEMAFAALMARLPVALRTKPAEWPKLLQRLLDKSKQRDDKGWHYIMLGAEETKEDKILQPLVALMKLGEASSEKLITY